MSPSAASSSILPGQSATVMSQNLHSAAPATRAPGELCRSDGESHIEDLKLEEHPELGAMINVSEVRVQEFDGSRHRDFNPLPERRLIIHLSGEVEIGASDGAKRVLRSGDIRLMEDVTGKGHSHNDLTPSAAVYVLLND